MALNNVCRKRRGLDDDTTKALIRAVENNPTIWNRQCKDHLSNTTLRNAWQNVSEEVSLSVDDCKAAWRSVRDSKRYHEKKRKKYQNKRILEDQEDWDFQAELSFLEGNSTPPRNFFTKDKSDDNYESPVKQFTHESEMPNNSQSTRNAALNMLTSSSDKIIAQIETFMKIKEKKKSNFEPFLNLINSILEQLPEVDAQRLSADITSLAYAKLNDHLSRDVKKEN